MTYTIDYNALYEKVDEIVSQTAAREYAEDGTSLYDSLIIPSGERHLIAAFVDGGVNALVRRLGSIACVDNDSNIVVLDTPDFDPALTANVTASINQYLVNYAAAYWFDRVAKDKVELFLNIAKEAIDNAAALAKTRRRPVLVTDTDTDTDTDADTDTDTDTDNETEEGTSDGDND